MVRVKKMLHDVSLWQKQFETGLVFQFLLNFWIDSVLRRYL